MLAIKATYRDSHESFVQIWCSLGTFHRTPIGRTNSRAVSLALLQYRTRRYAQINAWTF